MEGGQILVYGRSLFGKDLGDGDGIFGGEFSEVFGVLVFWCLRRGYVVCGMWWVAAVDGGGVGG